MASLLKELKRRNVFRVAVGYLVLAWVVLQIADLVAPALHLPEWTLSLVAFLGILGFPFALFFAWAFELTPEGIKRSGDVTPDESITHHTAGSLNKVIISLLCAAVAILLADKYLGLSGHPGIDQAEAQKEVAAAEEAGSNKPRSIAVLPFVNMSDDPEQEYFSDGISEELLNGLAQIQELRVAARTSSFAFKGKNQDITAIGNQLKVETVLEGSVRKAGPRVRITAQLISVGDGYHLWSDTYDRDLTDIFAVQDEISAAIVNALKLHLAAGESAPTAKAVNIDAYNLYLQGRHQLRQRTGTSLETARRQFQQAIDIDATYAQPWAGKALATQLLSSDSYGELPVDEAHQLAQQDLDTAFILDPDLAEAHAAQALLYNNTGRCEESLKSIGKAIAAMPSEGILYTWKSFCLKAVGDYTAADAAVEKGFEVDPLHRAVRVNWMQLQADSGNAEAVRKVVTEGTLDYYDAEFYIARAEGRWADMYTWMTEADKLGRAELNARNRGITRFLWLGEVDQAEATLPTHMLEVLEAMRSPDEVAAGLIDQAPKTLSPEQRHVLGQALISGGRCEEVPPLLADLTLESKRDFGDLTDGDSDYGLGTFLAWCLSRTGEQQRAQQLAERLLAYLEQAVERGLGLEESRENKVLLMLALGDEDTAVEILYYLHRSHWLSPTWFAYLDRFWGRHLRDREDYQQLYVDVQDSLNQERGKLGWPTLELAEL